MALKSLSARNDLERSLAKATRGEATLESTLLVVMDSHVAMPSTTEVLEDGTGMSPISYDRDGTWMVAVFSSLEALSAADLGAEFCLWVPCSGLLERMSREYGIVINPGFDIGLEILPWAIPELLRGWKKGNRGTENK